MAGGFTDCIYQGRSAEEFGLFYFLPFDWVQSDGNEACPGLGGLSHQSSKCDPRQLQTEQLHEYNLRNSGLL